MPLWFFVIFLFFAAFLMLIKLVNAFSESDIQCIDIYKSVNNISKFTFQSLKKKTISRDVLERNSSIDIIDALKNSPSINITQSGARGQQHPCS